MLEESEELLDFDWGWVLLVPTGFYQLYQILIHITSNGAVFLMFDLCIIREKHCKAFANLLSWGLF